jgi:hypothetical protein
MKLKKIGSNMTELHTEDGAVVLFSYSTPVAAQLKNGGFVRTNESYSRTTTRHINKWLDGRSAKSTPLQKGRPQHERRTDDS